MTQATYEILINSNKGRIPAGSLHGENITQDTIFDALAPSIPNTNDEIIVSGVIFDETSPCIVSKAKRTGENTIDIYFGLGGATGGWTMTNGNATTIDSITISW